jgi:DNA-binding MarR family transcriptional regulator
MSHNRDLAPKRKVQGESHPPAKSRSRKEEEPRAAFDLVGDRIIDVTRRWLRSSRRQRLQHDVYSIRGVELSLAQIDALESIALGDIRMHELAEFLHIDPSTATRTVAPLVDLGLAEREMDPVNRRYVLLRCTTVGRSTASRISKGRRQLMEEVLEPMSPDRRLLLAELLEEFLMLINTYDGETRSERHANHRAAGYR